MGAKKVNIYGGAHRAIDGMDRTCCYRLHRSDPGLVVEEHAPDGDGSLLTSLRSAAAQSQLAFDALAANSWSGYSARTMQEKAGIRWTYSV